VKDIAINGKKRFEDFHFTLEKDQYVYNPLYGYGLIIFVNEKTITLLWKQSKEYFEIPVTKHYHLEEVETSFFSVLKLEPNDLIWINISKQDKTPGIVEGFKGNRLWYLDIHDKKTYEVEIVNVELFDSDIKDYVDNHMNKISFEIIVRLLMRKDYYLKNEFLLTYHDIKNKYTKYNNNLSQKKSIYFNKLNNFGGIYLSSKYKDMEDYLNHEMLNKDLYRYDYNIGTSSYNYLLNKICTNYGAINIDNEVFLTTRKLVLIGIKKNDFTRLKYDVNKLFNDYDFLTSNRISTMIENKIINIYPNTDSIANVISILKDFKKFKIGGKDVFVRKNKLLKQEIIEMVFKKIMNENGCNIYYIEDFMYLINDKFDLDYTIESIKIDVNKLNSLYYSDETEKIYFDKKIYNKEVFFNDGE
jgi:hypothetical protein